MTIEKERTKKLQKWLDKNGFPNLAKLLKGRRALTNKDKK